MYVARCCEFSVGSKDEDVIVKDGEMEIGGLHFKMNSVRYIWNHIKSVQEEKTCADWTDSLGKTETVDCSEHTC